MFQPVRFTPSASVNAVKESIASQLSAASQALAQGVQALNALAGAQPATMPDVAELASVQATTSDPRETAQTLLGAQVPSLVVTPYQHGIGQRRGEHAYLTPLGAIKAICERMQSALPTNLEAIPTTSLSDNAFVLLLIVALTPEGLAEQLANFNAVMPLTELQQAERRARALATLDVDKFVIPPAPSYPAWGVTSPLKGATGKATGKALGAMLASHEGQQAIAASPLAKLCTFGAEQQTALTQKAQDLADIANGMTGSCSGWFGVYLEGAVAEIARLLGTFTPPMDDAFKCSAALCWQGNKQHVAYYKEAFGLTNSLENLL